jgi:penicillin amidase
MPSPIGRAAAAGSLATLLWLGWRGAGPLPPLGPLVDPVHGAWGLATSAKLPRRAEARIPGLVADVRVMYDDRAVPHIFAARELDAIRALGYVVARDRLFQLDLQARAGGGTLTGLLGQRALELDREARGLGMGRAAERLVASLADTSDALRALEAYAAGVNAYLDAMPARELPLEYRLLGSRPARWTPLRTLQVMLRMSYTLARSDVELAYLRAAAAVGDSAAAALFPLHSPIQEPIQPSPGEPRRLPASVPPPGAPDTAAATLAAALPGTAARARGDETTDLGSNNWAVAPARARGGAAILAGDPHLDLTLPSIWYEAQLVVPGVEDVYGVTIAGLPAIVIGFNRELAWTFTNTDADLMDRWVEEVDDPARPLRYRVDGAWLPIELRVEAYVKPRGDTIALDTLRFSHRGPMRRIGSRWMSLRWTALESAGDAGAFQRAARAGTVGDWLAAMAQYRTPPQNMLVADRAGTIAIRSTGRFPVRPGGRGDRVHDGTTRATDWSADWGVAEYPQAVAPRQGFLASANQEPQDPRDQPRYLGADWVTPWRALRINQLLRGDSAVTVETARRWQTDPGSARADYYVPYFLHAAAARPADTALAHAARLLGAWDRRYTLDAEGAVLFEAAVRATTARLWDELPANVSPGGGAFIALLDDSTNVWWDERATTGVVERRDDILSGALVEAYAATLRQYGPPEAGGWRWSRVHRIGIRHLLGIPALSARDIAVPGGPSTLSPSSTSGGGEGASWRMVVELGPEVRAWGTYPGGQSGNPVSGRYEDRLPLWQRGDLATLRFPRAPAELTASSELLLRSAR